MYPDEPTDWNLMEHDINIENWYIIISSPPSLLLHLQRQTRHLNMTPPPKKKTRSSMHQNSNSIHLCILNYPRPFYHLKKTSNLYPQHQKIKQLPSCNFIPSSFWIILWRCYSQFLVKSGNLKFNTLRIMDSQNWCLSQKPLQKTHPYPFCRISCFLGHNNFPQPTARWPRYRDVPWNPLKFHHDPTWCVSAKRIVAFDRTKPPVGNKNGYNDS